ncbi:MAG: hypothetical protein P4L31_03965, partial [Candidatus Babeliales bacterium]|nr:hypothetical protein [Candidatus Babeliales bacterium]
MYTTYKKLTLFTVLPLTLLYAHAHASAPAPTRPVEKVSAQVWGDMYLVSSMKYLGEDPQDLLWGAKLKHILDDKHQPIALKSSDVTVDVWVSSDDSEHWADHGHPILGRGAFPSCLPISMLEGKKEGEPLIFTLQCPMIKKICKVLLLCHGRNCEKFELQLNRLKESFNDELHYNCGDEERLLAQQIIVRNPAGT